MTHVIARVLNTHGEVLGEAEVQACGDGGALWAVAPVFAPITQSGIATDFAVYWPELDYTILHPIAPTQAVFTGGILRFAWDEKPILVATQDRSAAVCVLVPVPVLP